MSTGTVKWFNSAKGFGFIEPEDGGGDVFVHVSALERAGLRGLNEGEKVNYEIVTDRRTGKASADNLESMGGGTPGGGAPRPAPRERGGFGGGAGGGYGGGGGGGYGGGGTAVAVAASTAPPAPRPAAASRIAVPSRAIPVRAW